jgi:hypothetical protein
MQSTNDGRLMSHLSSVLKLRTVEAQGEALRLPYWAIGQHLWSQWSMIRTQRMWKSNCGSNAMPLKAAKFSYMNIALAMQATRLRSTVCRETMAAGRMTL